MCPDLCRERRGSQGDPSGSFAGLDSRAFLPAMTTRGARDGNVRGLALEISLKAKATKLSIINEKSEKN